jgi:hypothetical protein
MGQVGPFLLAQPDPTRPDVTHLGPNLFCGTPLEVCDASDSSWSR